jgi:hypothetical protein
MESDMIFSAPQPSKPSASAVARDALSIENQQIRPARQLKGVSQYDLMMRKLDSKPSVHEILVAYSQT